jgi:uncharacterized protein YgiB involved in biofilm formation
MFAQSRNKLAVTAATGLVILALASTSARANHDYANHDHDVVTPLVAGFALGALLNYGHSSHHYYRYQYQRHGHSGRGSGHRSGYSSGHGYSSHYKKSYSKGQYGHKPRHSSSRGNRHTPRRKH